MTLLGALRRVVHWQDCWLWTGAKTGDDYGVIIEGGRKVGAHRWLYERLVGPVPEGLDLDHLCRRHDCVNPDHLEPVTHQENIRRGDLARHERHGSAKLTIADVAAIRRRARAGESRKVLALEYGLTVQYVGELARGFYWNGQRNARAR